MGVLRLLLALTVLNWHYPFVVPVNFIFSYSAVFIFMMISGFYISMVLDQRYGKGLRGTLEFYGNRLLRLLPAYWTVLVLCRFFRPDAPIGWNDFVLIPQGFLHLEGVTEGNLYLGQMYTVTLELGFYAIAPLIVLKSLPWLLGAFAAAAVYTAATWWAGLNIASWQYNALPGMLLYFFAGALAYRLDLMAAKWRFAPLVGYLALPLIVWCGRLTPSAHSVIWTNNFKVFASTCYGAE